jgi:hypothetical protein
MASVTRMRTPIGTSGCHHFTQVGIPPFPWDGGRRTLSFTALCGQPAGFLELPVDPMPTLAPIGDMIIGDGSKSSAD